MSPRIAVVIGLLAGVLAGVLMVVAVLAVGPDLARPLPTAPPSVPAATAFAPPSSTAGTSPVPPPSAAPLPSARPPAAPVASASVAPSALPSVAVSLPPRSPIPGAFHVGQPAPALVLPLLGGDTIDLAKLKGKPVWVNFMGTYCPPCRDEFPVMSGFQVRYADTGLVVLAVDVREDTEAVQTFIGETGATFAVALDRDGAAQKAWGAVALPVHYWIDAKGIVRDGALGGIGPDQMAQSLALILPGVEVTP